MPFACELRDLLLERAQEQLHQDRDFVGRAPPVLAREREQRQELDVALDAGEDDRAHRLDARADGRRRAAACRCFAQRPLPSMMMATWRGTARDSGMSRVELVNMARRAA